jgi:PAS domain S-box-containing protein
MTRRCRAGVTLLLLTLTTLCASAASPKRVLILDPFGRDVEPFSGTLSTFRTTLARELGEPLEFYEISLDEARFQDPEAERPFVQFLESRIANRPMDLVVTVGGSGIDFLGQHHERLFPGTPIVLIAGPPEAARTGSLAGKATQVTVTLNLAGMVEDILQLQPQTTNIAVVFGASALETATVEKCRLEFQQFTNRVAFTWLNDLPLEQMLDRCAHLPPRSFILHALFVVDAAGVPCEKNEALRRLHQVANAPLFGYFASEFGLGPIGGRLYQDTEIGAQAARAASRILRGESVGNIPVQVLPEPIPVYDWRELKRWGINESRLPPGSIVEYRQRSFWDQYGWHIAGVVAFCGLQTALIIGLLVNRAKRRQGEAAAALIADISSKFVNLPPAEVDREIEDAMRRICESLDIDLAVLWQWSEVTPDVVMPTHAYCVREELRPSEPMRQDQYPWAVEQILAGRTFTISSLEDFPAEAAVDRATCRQFGIKAGVCIPLSVGGEPPIGALGLNSLRAERDWPDALVKRLQLVAQIFANALARRRADQALRASEEKYRELHQSMRDAFVAVDLTGRIHDFNAPYQEMLGYSAEELRRLSYMDLTPERWHEMEAGIVRDQVLTRGYSDVYEKEYRRKDGTKFPVELRTFLIRDQSGQPTAMWAIVRDLTERKQTKKALGRLQRQNELILNSAAEGILGLDLQGNHLFVNPSAARMLGYQAEELLGSHSHSLWHHTRADGSPYPEEECKIYVTMATGKVHRESTEVFWRKDGTSFPVEYASTPIYEEDRLVGAVVTFEDITERRRAEEKVRQLSLAVEQGPVLVVITDLQGKIIYVNRKFSEVSGYSLAECIGQNPRILKSGESPPATYQELWACITSGNTWRGEFHNRKKNGELYWERAVISPLLDAAGKATHFVGVKEDITERKHAEAELVRQRMELARAGRITLLGQLASALAHELSQPLGAILRNAEAAEIMLQAASPDSEELRAIITDILRDDQRAGQVIDRLRSLLKQRRLETQPLELPDVIGEVFSLVQADAAARHVKLTRSAAPNLPMVSGDRIHLQQVLLNLLLNAMDAMEGCSPDQRSVQVSARQTDPTTVEVRVADHGSGIPGQSVARLFEPFFTTKPKGMGMGLAVSKTIIEAHKGKLWAENRPEGGACFCFTLPVAGGKGQVASGEGTRG